MESKCRQILNYYEEDFLWRKKQGHSDGVWVVEQLTDEELEVAAQRSYAFWWLFGKGDSNVKPSPSKSTIQGTALREALRHMEGIETKQQSLELLRATIKFHQTQNTQLFRTCFDVDDMSSDLSFGSTASSSSESQQPSQAAALKQQVEEEMRDLQTFVIRGHDVDGHSLLVSLPRKSSGTSDQSFSNVVQYSMERAIACTEFITLGRKDKVVVVLDTLKSAAPPSVNACKQCVQLLQAYYPGRLLKLIILNPPFILLALHKLVKPFLDPDTGGKFVFLKGDAQKLQYLEALIPANQATPTLLPGKGKLTRAVDYKRFLYNVPFHCLYDHDDGDVVGMGGAKHSHSQPFRSPSRDTSTTSLCSEISTVSAKSLAVGEIIVVGSQDDCDAPKVVLTARA